MRKSYIYILN